MGKNARKIDERLGRLADEAYAPRTTSTREGDVVARQTDNRLNDSADATANTGSKGTARGTVAAIRPATPLTLKNIDTSEPIWTTVNGLRVKSWIPGVLVGTSRDQMRKASLGIIRNTSNHPLSGILVKDNFLSKGRTTKEDWAQEPRILEMGHARSHREGGKEAIVWMSAHQNQKFSGNIERTGGMALDDALDIGGIAVHRGTAWDFVEYGHLSREIVETASVIRFY